MIYSMVVFNIYFHGGSMVLVLMGTFCFVGYFYFNPRKILQFSEVASVACCLFAQYSKEGLLPSVASSSIARDQVH